MSYLDIVVAKRDLERLLDRIHQIPDKKSPVPALANVLLSTDGQRQLRVAATDLYRAMTGTCECEVAAVGSIAVPAKDLYERVKAMPDGPIQITVGDGSKATVKAVGHARRYSLHGLPGHDFPMLPKPAPDGDRWTIPVDMLALLMTRTHFSISTDETRAHVNSMLLEIRGNRMVAVSTDGHRLSKMDVRHGDLAADGVCRTFLFPLRAVSDLRRLLDQARSEKVPTFTLEQSGPCAFITVAGMQFSVKLVDATFPPFTQVIPASVATKVRVPRLALIDAVKAIQIAASDRTGGIKLTLVKGALRITSESPESGNAFDEVPVDHAGAEITIGFNAKYLLDVLSILLDDEVELGFGGELDPMMITPPSNDDTANYTAVVMPMRC